MGLTNPGQALNLGWEFLTFGIGVNGQKLAAVMGLPDDDDHAFTLEAKVASLHQAQDRFSSATAVAPDIRPQKW